MAKKKNPIKKLKSSIKKKRENLKRLGTESREELKKIVEDFKEEMRSFKGPMVKEFGEIAKEFGADVKELVKEPAKTARLMREKRYEYAIKKLGLEHVEKEYTKKLLIIQVDGLSYDSLKAAMQKGYCRNLRMLMKRQGFKIQKFNCGLPSMTPTFQAGIMYGDNSYISGFRFVDKKKKREFTFSSPNDALTLETDIYKNKQGILKEGCSYANLFSGGAERSILTVSTLSKGKMWKKIKESDILALLFLNPLAGSQVLYHSIREFLVDIGELVFYKVASWFKREYFPFVVYFPFKRIVMSAVLREIMTLGCILDIKRGMPRIYINYNGYDELSHYRGPESRSARLVLRDIDQRIGKLLRQAKDDYDIYILSDHGHTRAIPFKEKYGLSLGEVIDKNTAKEVESMEVTDYNEEWPSLTRHGFKKLVSFLTYLSKPLASIGNVLLRRASKKHRIKSSLRWSDDESVIVMDNSSIAQLYFNFSSSALSMSSIKKRYPFLINNLVHHPGIGLVVGREGKEVIVVGKQGTVTIGKRIKVKGKNILKPFGDPVIIAKQIQIMAGMKTAGDLTLMGAYENGAVVSFTGHIGSHGGMGGPQNWPFFLSKKRIDVSGVYHPAQLYHYFKKYI